MKARIAEISPIYFSFSIFFDADAFFHHRQCVKAKVGASSQPRMQRLEAGKNDHNLK